MNHLFTSCISAVGLSLFSGSYIAQTSYVKEKRHIEDGSTQELVVLKLGSHTGDWSSKQQRRPREYAYIQQLPTADLIAVQNFSVSLRPILERATKLCERANPSLIQEQVSISTMNLFTVLEKTSERKNLRIKHKLGARDHKVKQSFHFFFSLR